MKTAEEWVRQMGLSDSDVPTVRAIQAEALRWAAQLVHDDTSPGCVESINLIYNKADAIERGE